MQWQRIEIEHDGTKITSICNVYFIHFFISVKHESFFLFIPIFIKAVRLILQIPKHEDIYLSMNQRRLGQLKNPENK